MRYIITLAFASTPALAEVPKVVTDIPPVHALVAQVMGDLGQPELLLARGADEHDFQLKPSQAAAVARSDLVVWIGPSLTPWLDSAMDSRADGAAVLGLLDAEGTVHRPYDNGGLAEADEDDLAAENGHDDAPSESHGEDLGHEDDHDTDHGNVDPHVWHDPDNAKLWLAAIAAELARLDPANAATYQANAAAAVDGLTALDAEVAAILAPVQGKPIVTFHDAYGYFADHYGLTMAGSIALGDAASPGAQRLSALRATMESGDVLCIFPEAQHDPVLITQMAEGTGARIGGLLDPVGSTLEPGPGAYAAFLKGMAQTMADCLAG
jgi:zinc transport system substrate-binding protein